MARRPRQSSAVGHGSDPLQVAVIDPVDEHPVLGPLRLAKAKRLIKRTKGGRVAMMSARQRAAKPRLQQADINKLKDAMATKAAKPAEVKIKVDVETKS